MTVVILPAGLLFLLHHLISWRFELSQYGAPPDTIRFWILLALYLQSIVALIIGGANYFLSGWSKVVHDFKNRPIYAATAWTLPFLLWLSPTISPLLDIRQSSFNSALGAAAEWCDSDGPQKVARRSHRVDHVFKQLAKETWYPSAPYIGNRALFGQLNYKAILVLAGVLLEAGEGPEQIAEYAVCGQGAAQSNRKKQAPIIQKQYELLESAYRQCPELSSMIWRHGLSLADKRSLQELFEEARQLLIPKA